MPSRESGRRSNGAESWSGRELTVFPDDFVRALHELSVGELSLLISRHGDYLVELATVVHDAKVAIEALEADLAGAIRERDAAQDRAAQAAKVAKKGSMAEKEAAARAKVEAQAAERVVEDILIVLEQRRKLVLV